MKHAARSKWNTVIFVTGLLVVLFMGLPYLLLGQEAVFTYHDQLDGEFIAYLLQARHLFRGEVLPEFMNGALKTALIPPAPAFVLLFFLGNSFGNSFWVLVLMQLLGSLCGYVGMYLLVRTVAEEAKLSALARPLILPVIAMVLGVIYAYLPFLPVYGLAQYGLPLLLWCFWQARTGRYVKIVYVYGVVYALTSSLVLVGFAVLSVSAVWILWSMVKWYRERAKGIGRGLFPKHMLSFWCLLLLVYVIENASLLQQTLGIGRLGNIVSHKAEYAQVPVAFGSAFLEGLTKGTQHSLDNHGIFLAAVLLVLLMGLLGKGNQRLTRILGLSVGCNFCFAFVAALWDSALGIALRSGLRVLGAFQLNRLLWLAPCLWYLSLACALLLLWELVCVKREQRRLAAGICCTLLTVVVGVTGICVLLDSNIKPNFQKLRNPDYAAMSFGDYYAMGVMDQVEAYIRDTTGEAQKDYRVVSLGIDPAAALYHGFYCLDGYSNNYSLEYKHSFRKIIEPELAKSDYLQQNFDDWGNRCYLFSSECPGYYTIEKNGFYFQNYSLNTEALKAMGGKYLLSAAYIQGAEEKGLKLLREAPFETEDSYYRIFLYLLEG